MRESGICVSSTTSCSSAAQSVVTSSLMSARMCATSSGWERYGSPDSALLRAVLLGGKLIRAAQQLTSSAGRFWRNFASQLGKSRIQRASGPVKAEAEIYRTGAMLYFTSPKAESPLGFLSALS